jgi:hypothetical protein
MRIAHDIDSSAARRYGCGGIRSANISAIQALRRERTVDTQAQSDCATLQKLAVISHKVGDRTEVLHRAHEYTGTTVQLKQHK